MEDYCVRAIAADGQIRAIAARTTNLCEEARSRHDLYPTAAAALGRVMTATAMLSLGLQEQDTLTVRVLGDGPLGAIICVAEAQGKIRGYVSQPHTHLPSKYPGKLDVGSAVGKNGFLHVTKDLGMRDPYTGSVPLVSGEIGEDFARYFLESEQIHSAVALGVLVESDNHVRAAGGYLIQLMPGVTEETITRLETKLADIEPVSQLIDKGLNPEEILNLVLGDFEPTILVEQEVNFQCTCSKERLERILLSLGTEELADMLEKDKGAELHCHFCNAVYNFDAIELGKLLFTAKQQLSEAEAKNNTQE